MHGNKRLRTPGGAPAKRVRAISGVSKAKKRGLLAKLKEELGMVHYIEQFNPANGWNNATNTCVTLGCFYNILAPGAGTTADGHLNVARATARQYVNATDRPFVRSIALGNKSYERDGDSIILTKIALKIRIGYAGDTATGGATPSTHAMDSFWGTSGPPQYWPESVMPGTIRLLLVVDKDPRGVPPATLAPFFETGMGYSISTSAGTYITSHSKFTPAFFGRFKVLKDKKIRINPEISDVAGMDAAYNLGVRRMCRPWTREVSMAPKLGGGIKVLYKSGVATGDYGDIMKNGVYLIVQHDGWPTQGTASDFQITVDAQLQFVR